MLSVAHSSRGRAVGRDAHDLQGEVALRERVDDHRRGEEVALPGRRRSRLVPHPPCFGAAALSACSDHRVARGLGDWDRLRRLPDDLQLELQRDRIGHHMKVLSNQPRGPIPARIYIFRGLDVPTRPLRRRLARVPPVERRPRLVLLDAPPPLRVARRAIKPPAHRVREPRADAAAVGGAR
eukprot:gene1202-biopygen4352